jgi:hypothetical protein
VLHCFNPGHETAVLNGSPHYTPARSRLKMQTDLAYIPAWYACGDDYVLVNEIATPADDFRQLLAPLSPRLAKAVVVEDIARRKDIFCEMSVVLWGISPQSCYLFEKINKKHEINLIIPSWHDIYKELNSRQTARICVEKLVADLPEISSEIVPQFYAAVDEIQQIVERDSSTRNNTYIVKTPYSSSGCGLLWLNGVLQRSERQLLAGMLKRQHVVSVEKALNKAVDFSAQFFSTGIGKVNFQGYTLFRTDCKGNYEGSMLASQAVVKEAISSYLDIRLVESATECLRVFLETHLPSTHTGSVGVDMLIYESGEQYRLHPCVEINLRYNMGFLALRLFENFMENTSTGFFHAEYCKIPGEVYRKHAVMKQRFPLRIASNGKIASGYFPLCPVTEKSHYHAWGKINLS